jgi:propanediol dehydratase small subunit
LKFAPSDRILSIYEALYPIKGFPDALEVETLARELEKANGIKLATIWNETVTLGDAFAAARPDEARSR